MVSNGDIKKNVILIALYFVTAKLGLTLSTVAGVVTLVWPPTGVGLAAVLLFGYRMWPGLVIGAFLTNITTGAPLGFALATAVGNPLPPLAGAFMLGLVKFNIKSNQIRGVLFLVLLGGLIPTILSATVGTAGLLSTGMITGDNFSHTWFTWWLGDTMGVLIVTPALLSLSNYQFVGWNLKKALGALAWLMLLVLTNLIVYGTWFENSVTQTLVYLSFPLLIWISLSFGTKETALATLLITYSAVYFTSIGAGPFIREALFESLGLIWSFMGAVSITAMFLAAAMDERNMAVRLLSDQRDTLEKNVFERTADLTRMNTVLKDEIAERKQVEKQLHLQAQMISQVHDSVISVDLNGLITSWNKGSERLFQFADQEAIGEHVKLVYPEESHDMLDKEIIPTLLSQGSLEIETTLIRKNADHFDAMVSLSVLRNSGGGITGMIGYTLDITKLKQVEQEREHLITELRQNLEKIKTLKGLVPICANCKKIRDDKGYWNQLESYIEKHSDASFSHGICPDCSDRLYGKEDWY